MIDKICPYCGRRFSDFINTGLLGCPGCYKAFEENLVPYLKKIQGKTTHNGSFPKISKEDKDLLKEYHDLLKKKEIAGIEGRFFDMSTLSDEISCLIEELKERGLL